METGTQRPKSQIKNPVIIRRQTPKNFVFVDTKDNLHPYECGGVKEHCPHCEMLRDKVVIHTMFCPLCEDKMWWDENDVLQKPLRLTT